MVTLTPPVEPPGPTASTRASRRTLALPIVTAALTGGLAVGGAALLDLPLRDPDGFLGPGWLRMPLIVGLCLLVDVLPRVLWRARGGGEVVPLVRAVLHERWPLHRLVPILIAVMSFYVTYVGYRNLKNFLPFVYRDSEDWPLVALDRVMAFGNAPAEVLHAVLGTGVSAHVLSGAYMAYLFFVPISVAVALIWSKDLSHGLWYVSALCLNWALGTVSYYLIPASGPFYVLPWEFLDLPPTDASALQASLLRNRASVLMDPNATGAVSGVAAFASLHVSVIFTAALVAHLVRVRPVLRHAMWTYFVLVVISTIYFGWHYVIDDIAGMAIGGIAVWMGAWATGNLRSRTSPPTVTPARGRLTSA